MSSQLISKDEMWGLVKAAQENLKELSASQKKTAQEAAKEIKELRAIQKETNQQIKSLSTELSASQKKTSQEVEKEIKELRAIQKETDRQIKTLSAETDRQIKTLSAETDHQIKTLSAETDHQIKENLKGLNKARELFETQWGRLMESLVRGDLVKLLNEKGIKVINTHPNIEHKGKDQCEYDIVATNGEEVVVVEVKTTLKAKHIKFFLEDVKKFTTRLPEYKSKRIYGAVAYLRTEEESARYAENQGLFVIRATGSSASIINKDDFTPKVFS